MNRLGRFVAGLLILGLVAVSGLPGSVALAQASHPFQDVTGTPYESVISALWELGVVTGYGSTYDPNGQVTRAQMAALIVRAMGRTAEADQLKSVESGFSDVPQNHWALGVIAYANRTGIIKGDAGKFSPNDPVNYAQAATMLVRALGYDPTVIGGYPAGYVLRANELGLIKDAKFELFANVNRAEAAVLLYNAVFRVPANDSKLTWSQKVFKRPAALSFQDVPAYVAPGQQIVLNAIAKDAMGNPIPNAAIEYRVMSGSATVNGAALTVGTGGAITVQAKLGDLTATANLLAVTSLSISPETFQANKDGTVQLSATALAGAQRVAVQPVWRIKQGPARVDNSGLVTVTDYGAVTVEATLGSLSASSNGQAVGKVTITGKPDYLVPGQPATFSAAATDSTGRAIDVPVTWTATGATIDRTTGRLTNPAGNQVTVRATAAGISQDVTIPVLRSVVVSPASANVLSGRQVAFTAKGLDSAGNQYEIEPQWSRTNATIGIINNEGTFAGTASGSTEVVARIGNLEGRAQVRVSGQPATIRVAADAVTVPSGSGSTRISIRLLDVSGAVSAVSDQPIMISLADTSNGTVNRTLALTQEGEASVTYSAGSTPGVATISVTAPGTGLSGQTVIITSYQQTATQIQLAATPQPLATGGGVATVTATLRDNNGFAVPATGTLFVTLNSGGTGTGSLTGTTITIPIGQKSGSVSFISGTQQGYVQISGSSSYPVNGILLQTVNAGPASGVKIRPITEATPVTGLSSLMVQVDVTDASGVVRASDNGTQVKLTIQQPVAQGSTADPLSYTATSSGGTATFRVPAASVGTAILTASLVSNPDVTDRTTAEFVPGVISSLRLSALPATVVADGTSQVQVIAEVVDRSGNLVPNVNPPVTFRKLVEGGATSAVSNLTIQASSGRAVLTVQATRTAGTDTWYASAQGLETQNLATVTTSTTSGDAYTLRVSGSTNFGTNVSSTLVIQVVDSQGRVVTTDNGRTITASHTINGVTVTSAAVTQNGAATFAVLGSQATSGTVTFTTESIAVPTISVPITIGSSGTAYSLFPSTNTTSARIGSTITVWVRVMDSQGNFLSGDAGRYITASATGAGVVTPNHVSTANGMATFQVTGTAVGTATITFGNPELPQSQATLVITFTSN